MEEEYTIVPGEGRIVLQLVHKKNKPSKGKIDIGEPEPESPFTEYIVISNKSEKFHEGMTVFSLKSSVLNFEVDGRQYSLARESEVLYGITR